MTKIVVDPELAQQYARVKNISLEEANKRLEENMVKEALEVDLRQQYQVLIGAFRKMQPQLQGVVLRESDVNLQLAENKQAIASTVRNLEAIQKRLDFERDVFSKSMALLNNIIEVDAQTTLRIKELEAAVERLSTPLHKRVWNKIKWVFST